MVGCTGQPAALSPAIIEAFGVTVIGHGDSSRGGLQAENAGEIIMQGGTVSTDGGGSAAVWVNNGATVKASGITVTATGQPFDPNDPNRANISSALMMKQTIPPNQIPLGGRNGPHSA